MDVLSYIGGVSDILIIFATFILGGYSSFHSTIEILNQIYFFIGIKCDVDEDFEHAED